MNRDQLLALLALLSSGVASMSSTRRLAFQTSDLTDDELRGLIVFAVNTAQFADDPVALKVRELLNGDTP